jgi:thiol:disulfide interchange protein DsbD
LLGLNLAGLFEFGQLLPSAVINLQSRRPTVDAALSGVLAVAIASPCTAPFMGASMGLAIGLPLWQALPVFAAMGLGMALPYLGASLWPALAQRLPRPGAWMVTFRQAMAFPMFATVVWLVWVLGQQTGINGAGALLLLLVGLSLLVWTLTLSGRARIVLTGVALITGAALLYTVGPQVLREPALVSGPANPSAVTPGAAGATSDGWQPWSTARVDQLAAEGRAVFVDFTAAWCVTCQYNKQTTLSDPQVLQDFASKRVALLRADWTRRDPAITAALTQLGRSGVPVYVIYRAGQPPLVLPEILSVNEVRAELAKL